MAGMYRHDLQCACDGCEWAREQDADDRARARAEEPDYDTDPDEEQPC